MSVLLKNFCRCCLNNENLVQMNNQLPNCLGITIVEAFVNCNLLIEGFVEPNVPYICGNCCMLLETVHHFKKMCSDTDETLKKVFLAPARLCDASVQTQTFPGILERRPSQDAAIQTISQVDFTAVVCPAGRHAAIDPTSEPYFEAIESSTEDVVKEETHSVEIPMRNVEESAIKIEAPDDVGPDLTNVKPNFLFDVGSLACGVQINATVTDISSDDFEPDSLDSIHQDSPGGCPEEVVDPEPVIITEADTTVNDLANHHPLMATGCLSHIDDPTNFFIHQSADIGSLCKLQVDLQTMVESLATLRNYSAGQIAVCRYPLGAGVWYRVQIIATIADMVVVAFMDYGNTQLLTIEECKKCLKEFPAALADVQPYAVRCALRIKPAANGPWDDTAINTMRTLGNQEIRFQLITKSATHSFVELYLNQINIADLLLTTYLALPLDLIHTGDDCFVTHINSPGDFYVQFLKDGPELDRVNEILCDVEQFTTIGPLSPGLLCVAKYPADNCFYRSCILNCTAEGVAEVLFVDYGNRSAVTDISGVPEEIKHLRFLATNCALPNNRQSSLMWSEDKTKKFAEFAKDGETQFTIELLMPGELNIVNLSLNGQNIIDELTPEKTIPAQEVTAEETTVEEKATQEITDEETTVEEVAAEKPGVTAGETIVEEVAVAEAGVTADAETVEEVAVDEAGVTADAETVEEVAVGEAGVMADAEIVEEVAVDEAGVTADAETVEEVAVDEAGVTADAETVEEVAVGEAGVMADAETVEEVAVDETGVTADAELVEGAMALPAIEMEGAVGIANELEDIPKCAQVVHLESPENFYVHLGEDVDDIDNLADILATSLFERLKNPRVGDICGCAFENIFYRARILAENSTPEGGCEVQFIDYGNVAVVHEFLALPKNLQDLPPLAVHCKLVDALQLNGCAKSLKIFHDLVFKIDWFDIQIINMKEGMATVNLFSQGQHLLDMIHAELQSTDETTNDDLTESNTEPSVAVENGTEPKNDESVNETVLEVTNGEQTNLDVAEPSQKTVAELNNEPATEIVAAEDVTEPKNDDLEWQPQTPCAVESNDDEILEHDDEILEDVADPNDQINCESVVENVLEPNEPAKPTNVEPTLRTDAGELEIDNVVEPNMIDSGPAANVAESTMKDFFTKFE